MGRTSSFTAIIRNPIVGLDDVLVKVIATSVSRWDIKYRTGEVHQFYGKATGHHGGIHGRRAFPMPMQLGRDVAGEVVATGANVDGIKPGDRVVGLVHPENPASVNTMRGLGNLSTGVDLPGHTMFGGYAQYVARPQSYWIKISPALSFDQAAAAMWACSTAHHIVACRLQCAHERQCSDHRRLRRHGHRHASTGEARRRHADRHNAQRRQSRTPCNAWAQNLWLDTSAPDVLQKIREFTRGEGVDGAVEYTGATALMRLCIDAMRFGGTFCPVAGEMNEVPLRVVDLISRELNVHGVRASTRNDQRIVVELLEKGRITMPIHAVLPLVAGRRSSSTAGKRRELGGAHRFASMG